jgi:phage terminase large subunit
MDLDLKINKTYLPYLKDDRRTQIFFGGSSSGKSVFLAQRCLVDLLKGGRNYLIARKVGRYIKKSVFTELKKLIYDNDLDNYFSINQSEYVITCKNKYQALFVGLDDVEKVKSITAEKGVITDIWVEEATEVDKNDIKQLNKRMRGESEYKKRTTLSFNPILRDHWIYKEYFKEVEENETENYFEIDEDELSNYNPDKGISYKTDDLLILKTIYKNNKFLTPEDKEDLEDESDKYFYDVYTLGNWGVLGNVIFDNWEVQDLSGVKDKFDNYNNGLDFGYSNDPATLVRMHYDRERQILYILEELYQVGLTNDVLAGLVIDRIGYDRVICDSAEPKSVKELQDMGVNAEGAEKGKGSIIFGIDWLKRQTIIINKSCKNTIQEFSKYRWKENRSGEALREPVDKDNHIIDGIRYGTEPLRNNTRGKIRVLGG